MKPLLGAALLLGPTGIAFFVVYRITRGVESWFASSGAGDWLMWSVVAAVIIAALGIGAGVALGAVGLGLRPYVVRLEAGQYLESMPHALRAPARARALAASPQAADQVAAGDAVVAAAPPPTLPGAP